MKVMKEKKTEKLDAAILIQTYYRMWHCKTIYQQLVKFKEQKELQFIYFAQQVCCYAQGCEGGRGWGTREQVHQVP